MLINDLPDDIVIFIVSFIKNTGNYLDCRLVNRYFRNLLYLKNILAADCTVV